MEIQQAKKIIGLSVLGGATIGLAASLLDRFLNSKNAGSPGGTMGLAASLLDRFFNSNAGSPEPSGSTKTLKEAPLSEALTPMMEEAALLEWRKKYRKYRMGEEWGASGEASRFLGDRKHGLKMTSAQHLGEEGITEQMNSPDLKTNVPTTKETSLDDTFAFYDDKDGSWETIDRADPDSALTAYRRAYREHRMGCTKGAKGELADLPNEVSSPRRRVCSGSTAMCSEATEESQEDLPPSDLFF